MFQFSLTKTAVVFGLCAFTAMFASNANAQSGSRGSGARAAAPSFSPAQSYAPAAPVQAYAPTSTYQAPAVQAQSYVQPATSGCTNCQGGVSPSFATSAPSYQSAPVYQSAPIYQSAPVYQAAPVYQSAPVYQTAPIYNYSPAPVYQTAPCSGCSGF